MVNYILGVLGIAISVTLFLIGYRQTVGAKRERIGAANAELEKTLLRRVVLDKFAPSLLDLSRLIEGKARDYRIRSGELVSEAQLLNTIFTRVMESDLIPAEQREPILMRIVPPLAESEAQPAQEQDIEAIESSGRLRRLRETSIAIMALLASLLGAVLAFLPKIRSAPAETSRVLPALLVTIGASLTTIILAYVVSRLREGPDESSDKATELSGYFEFESRVRKALEEMGAVVHAPSQDQGFDFLVEHGGKKIAIEVKAWSKPLPHGVVEQIASRLRHTADRIGASELIIVTKAPTQSARQAIQSHNSVVKIMTLKELRNYLLHSS
jgi:HJR/Mrr/RecB family endonuclease